VTRRLSTAGLLLAALACARCGSLPTLRNKTDTATNLYESRNYDERRACEVPNRPPGQRELRPDAPGWCAPCADALNLLLDAKGLAGDAVKRAGRAPEQQQRLSSASAQVRSRCVSLAKTGGQP